MLITIISSPASQIQMLLRRALGLGRVLPRRALTASSTGTTTDTTPTPPPQSCDQKDDTVEGRAVTPEQDKQHYMPEGMGQDPADQGPSWLKPGESGYESKEERIPFVEDKLTGEKVSARSHIFECPSPFLD